MENGNVQEKSLPIFSLIYRNILLIVMVTVLTALIGLGYSVWRVKPTYTACKSVILRTTMSDDSSSALSNQAQLAKIYLETISKVLKSPDMVTDYNDAYDHENEKIVRSAIGVKYGEQSFIFTITYTDYSETLAVEKLDSLIETFSESARFQECVPAESSQLIHTQKDCDIVKSTSYVKYTAIGGIVGLVVTIALVIVVYMFDNTIKDRDEYEALTGSNIIAFIPKEKIKKNKA